MILKAIIAQDRTRRSETDARRVKWSHRHVNALIGIENASAGTVAVGSHSLRMICRTATATALLLLAACGRVSKPAPEYRPGEAGTVDHALCLLGFSAIPIRTVGTGHQLIQASINGKSGSFVLDTGANVTVVDQGQAQHFGLSGKRGGVAGIGAAIPVAAGQRAQLARAGSIEIGSIAIRQGQVVIADLGQLLGALGDAADETISGIVGQDVLEEHRAVIDVARPMLYLMEDDKEPAPVTATECRGNTAQQEKGS